VPGRPGRGFHDRRPARVRQAEQPADLVERLAGRVVHGLAEQPVLQVIAAISTRKVCPPDTIRATSGKSGSGISRSASASQAAYRWPSSD